MALSKPHRTVLKSACTVSSDKGFVDEVSRRVFLACYYTGKATEKASRRLYKAVKYTFTVLFSGITGKCADFARSVTELKRSRLGRGEFSVTRGIINAAHSIGSARHACVDAWNRKGLLGGTADIGAMLWRGLCSSLKDHRKALSCGTAVLGVLVLAGTVYFWSNVCFAVSVTYNGKKLGTVMSEQVYRDAINKVESNVAQASGGAFKLDKASGYKFVIAKRSKLLNENQLYSSIISSSGNGVKQGYGLYVDNRLAGADGSSVAIEAMLNGILAQYKNQPGVQKAEFVQNVRIKSGVYPQDVFKSTQKIQDEITGKETAQPDKSTQNVAYKPDSMYRISLDPLYAMTSGNFDTSNVVVADDGEPTLSVKVLKNEDTTQPIPFAVQQVPSDSLKSGVSKVSTPGKNGTMQIVALTTYINGVKTGQDNVSSTVLEQPVTQQVLVGTKQANGKHGKGSKGTGSGGINGSFASGPVSSSSGGLIGYAENALGVPYLTDGTSFSGFDCSGFTQYVFAKYGVSLEHSAAEQATHGTAVSRSSLASGDLVFFNTNGRGISHVGIYIGGGNFIDASSKNPHAVTVDSINSSYYSSRLVAARRILH